MFLLRDYQSFGKKGQMSFFGDLGFQILSASFIKINRFSSLKVQSSIFSQG